METLKKKNAQKQFILVLFIIFSAVTCGLDVLQSVTPLEFTGMSPIGAYGSQFGYTIVTFVLVYLIGAWLRDTEIRGSFLRLALYLILLFGWAYLERGTEFIYMFCWSYCNPLIILLAAELLLLFRRLPIGNKSWINLPAKASFTVYLVHLFIIPYLRIGEYADRGLFILLAHLAVSVIGVYLLCFIVWFVYEQVITRLIRATLGKTALSHNLYKNL